MRIALVALLCLGLGAAAGVFYSSVPRVTSGQGVSQSGDSVKGATRRPSESRDEGASQPAVEKAPHVLTVERQDAPSRAFEFAGDFWALAESALASKRSADLFEAHAAARECKGVKDRYADLRNFASGSGPAHSRISGDLTTERQKSVEEILKRCRGFIAHSSGEGDSLRAELLRRGTASGGPEFTQAHDNSEEGIARYLLSLKSPSAIAEQLPQLSILAESALTRLETAIDPKKVAELGGLAALLTTCEIGRDCSETSYSAQLACALSSRCGKPLFDGWENGLDPEEVAAVKRTVSRLADQLSR